VVQVAVERLCSIADKLTENLDVERIEAATKSLDALKHPLSSDDIRALASMLPDDDDTAFGLNWTILHSIEASPDWPVWDVLANDQSDWINRLRRRLANGGMLPPKKT